MQCSDGRYEHELTVYMVFEYMQQDLDQFIHQSQLDSRLSKVYIILFYYGLVNIVQCSLILPYKDIFKGVQFAQKAILKHWFSFDI